MTFDRNACDVACGANPAKVNIASVCKSGLMNIESE